MARGNAELAAVWDGTRTAFGEDTELWDEFGSRVAFMPLEYTVPNDLLVVSSSMGPELRKAIREAIEGMESKTIDVDDYLDWALITEQEEAEIALSRLRELAKAPIAPVTVRIQAVGDAEDLKAGMTMAQLVTAAREAVRLSGGEFVEWGPQSKRSDYLWKLEPTHDGAVNLHSSIDGLEEVQLLQISFENRSDLTERLGDLIRSRMHRIRYVWPYSDRSTPTVLRDVNFRLPEDEPIQVQQIRWLDRGMGSFSRGKTFEATVEKQDSHRFVLSTGGFDRDFNTMGDVSYRVVLPRPSEERPLFMVLTVALLVLFVAAGVAAVFDYRRGPYVPSPSETDLLEEAYRELVKRHHEPWKSASTVGIVEANILGQDRGEIEVYISDMKLAEKAWWRRQLSRLLQEKHERGLPPELRVHRDEISDEKRLAALIDYLVKRHKLSGFIGRSAEFEAWNRSACRIYSSNMSRGDRQPKTGSEPRLLSQKSGTARRIVSRHLDGVLKGAMQSLSLFRQEWSVEKEEFEWLLSSTERLPVALDPDSMELTGDAGSPLEDPGPITHLYLEFRLAVPTSQVDLRLGIPTKKTMKTGTLDACLFGLLDRPPSVVRKVGVSCLRLHFMPLAVIRGS